LLPDSIKALLIQQGQTLVVCMDVELALNKVVSPMLDCKKDGQVFFLVG
jgi:hypothetical protein